MQFSIPVDTIKALLLAAGKKDHRYYLNGVLIDVRATDVVAVATDGHKLLAVPLTLEQSDDGSVPYTVGQYILPRDILEGLKPAYKGAPATVTIDAIAQKVSINTGGSSVTASLIDGRYPEWRRVVPESVTHQVSQFDPDYIAAFGKMHTLLGGKHSPAIAHNGDGKEGGGPARIMLAGDAVGVLMPMRYTCAPAVENPAWLDRCPQQSTAAAA
jgi:DNA polymerase-3 subunit beta